MVILFIFCNPEVVFKDFYFKNVYVAIPTKKIPCCLLLLIVASTTSNNDCVNSTAAELHLESFKRLNQQKHCRLKKQINQQTMQDVHACVCHDFLDRYNLLREILTYTD